MLLPAPGPLAEDGRVRLASSLAALLLAACGAPSTAADSDAALRRFIEEQLTVTDLPGFSAAIVKGDRIAWSASFGHADLAARRVPGDDTLYLVASVSKLITAVAVMQQVEAGKL